jgi:hypothetical protein
VARRSKDEIDSEAASEVKGVRLEPIRVVRRQLTRPDGTTLEVDVPVYPPFRLEDRPPAERPARDKDREKGNGSQGSEVQGS